LIQSLKEITHITTGLSHSLAIDSNNRVFGWGKSDNGAIGIRE